MAIVRTEPQLGKAVNSKTRVLRGLSVKGGGKLDQQGGVKLDQRKGLNKGRLREGMASGAEACAA
jgi:hypothetical protein